MLALWDPIDGEVDPSGVTYAFAKAAKVHWKILHYTVVKDTKQKKMDHGKYLPIKETSMLKYY